MNKKNYLEVLSYMGLITLLVSFSLFLSSCSSSTLPNQVQKSVSQITQNPTAKLDEDNQSKLICLFFPSDNKDSNKTITFEFSKDLSSYKLKTVKLIQEDKTVSGDIEIKDVIGNKVTIQLPEFIPEFNKAEFALESAQTMTLNIGQYYLEKLDYKKNVLKDNQSYHLNNCTTQDKKNQTLSNYELSTGEPSKIHAVIPKRILEMGYTQKLTEKSNTNSTISYEYSGEIPLEYFKLNNTATISYEAIFQQETLDKGDTNFVFGDLYTLEAN